MYRQLFNQGGSSLPIFFSFFFSSLSKGREEERPWERGWMYRTNLDVNKLYIRSVTSWLLKCNLTKKKGTAITSNGHRQELLTSYSVVARKLPLTLGCSKVNVTRYIIPMVKRLRPAKFLERK